MRTSSKILLLLCGLGVSLPALAASTGTDWRQMGFSPKGNRYNPRETVLNASNVSGLALAWVGQTGNVVRVAPAIVDGVVYIGSWDGKLYAFEESSGTVKWTVDAPGIHNSSPAVGDHRVYIASNYSVLYAFNASTGALEWSGDIGKADFPSSTTFAHGVVYVSDVGHLYAFDAKTGALKWRVRSGSVRATPAVVDGVVYETNIGDSLRAYDAATGAVIWSTRAPLVSSPAFADGKLYAVYAESGNQYGVWAFDAGTGKRLWHAPFGGFSQSDLAVGEGTVYAGSFDGNLYAFDADTGATKWTYKAGEEIDDTPAVANGVVYFASTDDGIIHAVDAATGVPLWNAHTGSGVFSSPSVVNGMVFVGSDDNSLHAFAFSGRHHTEH